IGVGVVSAAEFGADSRVYAMPIRDCSQRMKETLVCLKEQSSRRVVATFLDIMRESLQPGASSKNA
ncbi:LysR family transcriptional regulator, partial [Pseudomonas lurida]|nr:LysR family transcriptional regulator [Pseudomonas lurida]MCF5326643.1 LysR family transcriptional regulator [Pseudomonas lurida]